MIRLRTAGRIRHLSKGALVGPITLLAPKAKQMYEIAYSGPGLAFV